MKNDLIELFKTESVVIECTTEEVYESFMDLCYANDMRWNSHREPYYKDSNCIRFDGYYLARSNKEFYKSHGFRIITLS